MEFDDLQKEKKKKGLVFMDEDIFLENLCANGEEKKEKNEKFNVGEKKQGPRTNAK